jgi:hypothetical protein
MGKDWIEYGPKRDMGADALQRYRMETFRALARESVEKLRSDPVGSEAYEVEIALWDVLAGDGLVEEEPYYTPGEEAEIEAEYARASTESG